MKRFSLRLEKDLHEKLRTESFKTERSINEIITELIEDKYKEGKAMKKELEILRSREDGQLTLAYKGVDLENYEYITTEEFIEEVESAESWDMIDAEIYEKALEEAGLDYSNYDDPDTMWEDFLNKVSN